MSRNKPNYEKFAKMSILPTGEDHEILKRHDYRTGIVLGNVYKKVKAFIPDHVEDVLHEKVQNGTITSEESALMFLAGASVVLSSLTGGTDLVSPIWMINGMSGRSAVEGDPELEKKLADNKAFYTVTRSEMEEMLKQYLDQNPDIRSFMNDKCTTVGAMSEFTLSIMEFIDERYERAEVYDRLNTAQFRAVIAEAFSSYLSYMEE